ncbi:hypothetical protein Q9L58_009685 [Maublancomyces gigas]|uniref:Nephrocystin 3-like N-terminal domain-containing protein n=1 Tax=Discina gigas TaxID=1032678 RepID=A0ABR3G656_9PEZI
MQAIVKQLSVALLASGLPKPVVAKYDERLKSGHAAGPLAFQESNLLLISLLDIFPRTTIIIDALDESDPMERGRLLEALTAIMHSSTSVVKIFSSSRDDIDIKLKLEKVPNLYIEAQDNGEDIKRFIDREMKSTKNRRLCSLPDELKKDIISTLTKKGNEMFQWVNLQIKHVNGMKFEKDIKENLGKLPKTLRATYSGILKAMREEGTLHEWEVTKKALMWISCSKILLTQKLWTKLSYWPGSIPRDGANTLLELCHNLVTWDGQLQVVRFAHLSVQEYLESEFNSVDSHSMAAECCLLLLDPILASPGEQAIDYSTRYWTEHVEGSYSCGRDMNKVLLDQLNRFLGTPAIPGQAYGYWLQTVAKLWAGEWGFSLYKSQNIPFHLESTPLNPYFAVSYFPFGEQFRELWESGDDFDFNCSNKNGETLLFVASLSGNEWAVKILLEKGADINAGNSRYGVNPLMAAIKERHGKIVARLVGGSSDVNGCLEAVAREGTATMFATVIDRIPNTTVAGAILVAVVGNVIWGKDLMEILVARDLGIEITGAVVTAAAENRQMGEQVITAILAGGRIVRITPTALVAVARLFSHEIMEILVARDLDLEITDAVVTAVAGNRRMSEQGMVAMLDGGRIVKITPMALVAVARLFGDGLTEILVARDLDFEITEMVVTAAARNWRMGEQGMKVILARNCIVRITPTALVAVARLFSHEVMEILVARDLDLEITEVIVIAAAGNWRMGEQGMKAILARGHITGIAPEALVAVAQKFGNKVMEVLLARCPNIKITGAVLIAAANNPRYGDKVMQVLLERYPNIEITEAVLIAAANNPGYGNKVMEVLLARCPDIKITEAVLIAAANNPGYGNKVMEVLLERYPDIEITEAALIAAINNYGYYDKALLERYAIENMITEAVVITAVVNYEYSNKLIEVLLARFPEIEITEAVVIAAARNCGYGNKVMKVLLARFPDIGITEAVLIAAAENELCSEELTDMLLAENHRRGDFHSGSLTIARTA